MQSRLEPSHAAGQAEIRERRGGARAGLREEMLSRSDAESPLDGAAKDQTPTDALTNEDASERLRQAEDAA